MFPSPLLRRASGLAGLLFALILPSRPAFSQQPGSASASLLTPDRERDLFGALNLSAAELRPVQDALARNDAPAARHLLANYYRQRTSVPWKFDPHHPDRKTPYNKQVADDAVRGHVKGGQIPVWANFPNGKIDWLYNETYHQPGAARNIGWQGQLTRMDFWEDMAAAYRATGDERYASAWVQQMRGWVQQCPPPPDPGGRPSIPGPNPPLFVPTPPGNSTAPPTGWVPIDAGSRLNGSWPAALFSFVTSPSVSDDDLLFFLYGYLLHGEWLSTHHGPGNGWMIERSGLYTLAAVLPEFKQSAAWREQAVRGQMEHENTQFLPDGVEVEISTGYQNVCIDCVVRIPEVAQTVGRLNEIPADYVKPLEKAYDVDLYLAAPGRQLPMFNDAWPVHVQGLLRRAAALFPERRDFAWMATDGKEGQPPAQTSYAFDYGGFYAMRSGWGFDANLLAFRDGPFVFSHGHQDKLSVAMWAYGREILFNSGGGPYDASKWRQYSIDTFSKNTVLVDGLPQRRPRNAPSHDVPRINSRWETTPTYDFAAGVYDEAYGNANARPATHTRRVLFLKPDLAVVADTLTPNDGAAHTYQARWHLLTTNTRVLDNTREVLTTDGNAPNLDIVPLNADGLEVRTASGQSQPELLGWNVVHTGVSQPAAATTVLQTRHGAGVQTFLTLLVPTRSGVARSLIGSVHPNGPGGAQVVFADGRKLTVDAGTDPVGGIEVTETSADGQPGRHVKAGAPRP